MTLNSHALLPLVLMAAANPPAPPPPWTGESGGFTVTISQDDIRAAQGERIAYSLAAVYRARLAELERMAQERAESMPLSLVGPYLSLEQSAWSDWPGAAHPSAFYDVVGEKVAVRIALSHGCELARGNLTQLGLLLEIPAALKADLTRARDGSGGFLLKAASVRFKGAGVSLSFQKDLAPLIEAARKKKKREK